MFIKLFCSRWAFVRRLFPLVGLTAPLSIKSPEGRALVLIKSDFAL